MKKVIIFAAIIAISSTTKTFAQDESTAWSGQGSVVVNAGYGFGNIWKTLFKVSSGFTGSKVSATGPVALGFEYGVAERIGVGLQLGYGQVKSVSTDPGGNSNGGDLVSTESLTSIQALVRGNYHFGNSEKFDPYIGLGLGYGNFKYKYSDNDALYPDNGKFSIPSAFGFSGALGARYYVASNIGIYAEIGYVTGSIAQVGLNVKF